MTDARPYIPYAELEPLLQQAEAEHKWLWCVYQDLWFSPAGLRAAHLKGKFRWGPANWKLRSPREMLDEAKARADAAQKNYNRLVLQVEESLR